MLSKLNTDAFTWNTSLRITEYGKSTEINSGWNTLTILVGDTPTPLLLDIQYESSIQSVIESGAFADFVIKPSSLFEILCKYFGLRIKLLILHFRDIRLFGDPVNEILKYDF